LLEKIAPGIVSLGVHNDARHPEQGEDQIDGAQYQGAGSGRSTPLNRQTPEKFDRSSNVNENFVVRNIPQRPNLLPGIEVMPD
jgi:hypothetical protein